MGDVVSLPTAASKRIRQRMPSAPRTGVVPIATMRDERNKRYGEAYLELLRLMSALSSKAANGEIEGIVLVTRGAYNVTVAWGPRYGEGRPDDGVVHLDLQDAADELAE